jgi:uncharacterized membrane protein
MATAKSRIGVFFKRGLRALLPTVLTIGVIVIVYNFFANSIVEPVNRGIRTFLSGTWPGRQVLDLVLEADIEPEMSRKQIAAILDQAYRSAPWLEPLIGFTVAFLLVFISGFILATRVGKRVLGRFEGAMTHFPIVKIIYPYARQVVEFFMREKTVKFHSVIALEYPRKGLYSLGFVTGLGMKDLNRATNGTLINVFIPSSPTPITGYVIFVPVEEAIPLPLTVDQAIRFSISGGVLVPEEQRNPDDILKRFQEIAPPSLPEMPPVDKPTADHDDDLPLP